MNISTFASRIGSIAALFNTTPENVASILHEWGLTGSESAILELVSNDKVVTFSDFASRFGKLEGSTTIKLRQGYQILRGADQSKSGDRVSRLKSKFGLENSLGVATEADLLSEFDPKSVNDPVAVELKKRFKDKPCIVYKLDGSLDVEATLAVMADLNSGLPEVKMVTSGGNLVDVYKIGDQPDQCVDEDPIWPGEILRSGRSTVDHRDWSGISIDARRMCRIAVTMSMINARNRQDVAAFVGLASKDEVSTVYPEVAKEFRKLAAEGKLPTLRVKLSSVGSGGNNPFGVSRRY